MRSFPTPCKTLVSPVLILALSAISGCVTRGQDFPTDLAWIKKSTTTVADVQKVLGEPVSVGSSGGTPTWTYGYYKYRLFGDSNTKELKFYFGPDRRVDTFSFSSSFPQDKRAATVTQPAGSVQNRD